MKCPKCGGKTHVINGRKMNDAGTIKAKRRWCKACGYRFSVTVEEVLREAKGNMLQSKETKSNI